MEEPAVIIVLWVIIGNRDPNPEPQPKPNASPSRGPVALALALAVTKEHRASFPKFIPNPIPIPNPGLLMLSKIEYSFRSELWFICICRGVGWG